MRYRALLAIVAITTASASQAITDQERTVLQRLHSELKVINSIVEEAEQSVNQNDRQQIDYVQLKADLQRIQEGVGDILNNQRREPRSLPSISGEYR
ncbi:MAG: RAQPRD family integrative conjugative element protein [Motiliproteus sp.]|nr:RAQPRD family integrative conjugative element protein [Motiliproteus sp.]